MNKLESIQYKQAILKYAEQYIYNKGSKKNDPQITEIEKRYVIYARKSTEDDKRQVQSIEDQIEQCKLYAKSNNLTIVSEPIIEEKSAKTAGKRDQFKMMLQRIEDGDLYNSILTWHPDRLARNMKESGEILDMLDNDVIADLKFPSYTFNNDAAGKMTLSILFAMAKEFADKLSEDTKRGNQKKVRDGKYMGSIKRGYYNNKDDYFRQDQETFDLYQNAWKDYTEGKSQADIRSDLEDKGEKISDNSMSNYFQDPFPAGIYCYGDQIVDLLSVDPKFKPMITPEEFILAQKVTSANPRGWKLVEDFRPFRELVMCSHCDSTMTPGLNRSKSGEQYLRLACSNSKCIETRREAGIKPVSNNIRGAEIVKLATTFYDELLRIDEKTYQEAKKIYFRDKSNIITEIKSRNIALKKKLTTLKKRETTLTERFYESTLSKDMASKISNDIEVTLNEIRDIESDILKNKQSKAEYEYKLESDFPNYESFLNLFKNIAGILESTDNAQLIDQLVKLAFLNISVGDKNVVSYEVREPFKTYGNLKILFGVAKGT